MIEKMECLSSEKLNEIISKTPNGKVVNLFEGDHHKNLILIRKLEDMKGSAERHERASELYYVISGQAELFIGGRIVDEKKVGEGEYKAEQLEGAKKFDIKSGDLVSLPTNKPHLLDATKSEIVYIIIKFNE